MVAKSKPKKYPRYIAWGPKSNYCVLLLNYRHWTLVKKAIEEGLGIEIEDITEESILKGGVYAGIASGKFLKANLATIARRRIRIVIYPTKKPRSVDINDYPNILAAGLKTTDIALAMGYTDASTFRRFKYTGRILKGFDTILGQLNKK